MDLSESNDVKRVFDDIDNDLVKVKKFKQNNIDDIIVDSTSSSVEKSERKNPNNVNKQKAGNKFISKLDHDCMAKIFMYLPLLDRLEMEKVCQKWKESSKMSWCNVKKIDPNNLMIVNEKKNISLKKILRRCHHYLTHLTIKDQYSWMPNFLKNKCGNIIHFDIDMNNRKYKISHEDLFEIITSMSKLKHLKVKMNNFDANNIYDKMLEPLPGNIEDIHLTASFVEPLAFAMALPNKFKNLRCLTLRKFQLTQATIESIILKKNTVLYLDLSYCYFLTASESIFSDLNNLEYLILYEVENLNNDSMIAMARNCSKVKYLEFSIVGGDLPLEVPYPVFHEFKYLKNLEHLRLPGVEINNVNNGANLIPEVLSNLKELKYLEIGSEYNFSQLDIQEIAKLKNLEDIRLIMAKIDSQALVNIASNCLELKNLSMQFQHVSEGALEKLGNLKKLTTLNFSFCENLTDNVFSKIASNCKNLVELDISQCKNITEASLLQVGKLKYLKNLKINNAANVPIAMFNNLDKLEEFSCLNCKSVNDECIAKVIDNCLNLSQLNIYKSGATIKTLVYASKRPFAFKTLYVTVEKYIQDDYNEKNIKSRFLKINLICCRYNWEVLKV